MLGPTNTIIFATLSVLYCDDICLKMLKYISNYINEKINENRLLFSHLFDKPNKPKKMAKLLDKYKNNTLLTSITELKGSKEWQRYVKL